MELLQTQKNPGSGRNSQVQWLCRKDRYFAQVSIFNYYFSVLGNTSKRCDDYIPLEMSSQTEGDGTAINNKTSKQHGSKQASSRTEDIESGSNTSDDDDDAIMVQYGAQRESRRRRTETEKEETRRGTDEDEDALAQLGGRNKKRPPSLSKSSKPKRSRRLRDSDSDESDGSTMTCLICKEKIPKEHYEKHVEQELEERKKMGGAPQKVRGTSPYFVLCSVVYVACAKTSSLFLLHLRERRGSTPLLQGLLRLAGNKIEQTTEQ